MRRQAAPVAAPVAPLVAPPVALVGAVRRRVAAAVVAVAAVIGLSACGGLPSTGPVVEGGVLGDVVNSQMQVSALGPVAGASKDAVVRGFLRAGEDTDETHQVGKLFLAAGSADRWPRSTEPVVIYSGELSFRDLGKNRVEVSAHEVARVAPDGRYDELPPGTRIKAVFALVKVGREWRIQLPPNGFGLWLDTDQFDRAYVSQNIYFVTRTGRDLVPDPRWFPGGSRLATTLARAQLAGVPAYLDGAVVTGVPAGTWLSSNAVPVDNGLAQVGLSSQALSADPDDRTRMWAQLSATLSQVPTVSAVSLAVDNTTLELPDGVTRVAAASELGYGVVAKGTYDTATVRRGDLLSRIDPRFVPDTSTTSRRADTKAQANDVTRVPGTWRDLALSDDSKQVAAISADRSQLSIWRATAAPRVIPDFATSLTRPVYDSTGYLWVGGTDSTGARRMYVFDSVSGDPSVRPKAVSAPWLTGRRIIAVAVAPDASRLLVVTSDRNGLDVQLSLTGIVRATNGEPTGLAPPAREAQSLTSIQDVTWIDTTTYAVLGQPKAGDQMRAWLGTIGAGLDGVLNGGLLAAVPGATRITTVAGPRGLLIVTSDDRVLARTGSTWGKLGSGSDVLVPGG